MAMAKLTTEQYCEAFKKSYSKLIDALPINDLLPDFFEAGVVPVNVKEKLNFMDQVPVRTSINSESMGPRVHRGTDRHLVLQINSNHSFVSWKNSVQTTIT